MTPLAERETLLMRGTLDMCVLTLLGSRPTHAYGVVQQLHDHGFTQTSYGTVYPLVSRLRRQGLVSQDLEQGDGGPPRNVLRLTDEGRHTLRSWTEHWHEVTARVANLMASSR